MFDVITLSYNIYINLKIKSKANRLIHKV